MNFITNKDNSHDVNLDFCTILYPFNYNGGYRLEFEMVNNTHIVWFFNTQEELDEIRSGILKGTYLNT
jgi:hypothetical protein